MAVNYISVGGKIRSKRVESRLTQMALADKLCCSPSYISYIENGVKTMSLDFFVDVANTLKISTDILLEDNLQNSWDQKYAAIQALLSGCSPKEMDFVLNLLKQVVFSMRKYDWK